MELLNMQALEVREDAEAGRSVASGLSVALCDSVSSAALCL